MSNLKNGMILSLNLSTPKINFIFAEDWMNFILYVEILYKMIKQEVKDSI